MASVPPSSYSGQLTILNVSNIQSVEELCAAVSQAGPGGVSIDLEGRCLEIDGTYRFPRMQAEAKGTWPAHLPGNGPDSPRMYDLPMRAGGGCATVSNGTLKLVADVRLQLLGSGYKMTGLTIIGDAATRDKIGAELVFSDAGCTATMTQSDVRSCAVTFRGGARLKMQRCKVVGSPGHGVWVAGSGTRASLEACSVMHAMGSGVFVDGGGQVELRDCVLTGARRFGIEAQDTKSSAHAQGCTLKDNAECSVYACAGAAVKLRSCRCSSTDETRGLLKASVGGQVVAHETTLAAKRNVESDSGGVVTMTGCTGASAGDYWQDQFMRSC